jgi:hypothetical protein
MGGACGTKGKRVSAYRVLVGKAVGRGHLENLGVDGSVVLKWIFKKWVWGDMAGLSLIGISTGGGLW